MGMWIAAQAAAVRIPTAAALSSAPREPLQEMCLDG